MLKVRTFWKDAIYAGKKNRSYRPWKRPFRVGSVHEMRPKRNEPGFGWVEITRVWRQHLGDITDADAQGDGYPTRAEMLEHFCLTYAKLGTLGKSSAWWKETLAGVLEGRSRGPEVWGMEFRLAEPPKRARR